MESWRELRVWQHAHDLALRVCDVTKNFPADEKFGLSSQLRRAAISVAANIVEGSKRKTSKDQQHFYVMVNSSLEEIKYYFILALHLKYIEEATAKKLTLKAHQAGKMLSGMINTCIRRTKRKT